MPSQFQRKYALCAALLLAAGQCFGQNLRVSSWNLQPAGTNELRVSDAAGVLKELNPDVILLQDVPNWKTCERLAEALKPAKFSVAVCSSFRDVTNNEPSQHQAAVLSRYHAYFSHSEPWRTADNKTTASGFAFVALRTGNQPLGFFSVELPDEGVDLAARQLLGQVRSVQGWQANKVEATLAGGTLGPGAVGSKSVGDALFPWLASAGFGQILQPMAEGQPGLLPGFISTEPPEISSSPKVSSSASFEQACLTYDVELDPTKLLIARATAGARVLPKPPVATVPVEASSKAQPASATNPSVAAVSAPAPANSAAVPTPGSQSKMIVAAAIAGLVMLVGIAWFLSRALRRPAAREPKLLAETAAASSYTIIVGSPSTSRAPTQPVIHIESPRATQTHTEMLQRRAEAAELKAERATQAIRSGVIANFSLWLKQKFVRRLIADRAELMETQEHATVKALAVEERLTRIEAQINLQNLGYQQRIDELTRELIAAKEENRELIRAQIRQVKAEMEAARERMLAEAREQNPE